MEAVHALAARGHALSVFVDDRLVPNLGYESDDRAVPGTVRVESAHQFPWRQGRGQHDLVVYQLGNSRLHDYLWPYLFRYPGLAVLHDARLHHARARTLLTPARQAHYRTEFTFNHPDVQIEAAELAVHGFDGRYYYLWPMTRSVVAASLLVAAHARGGAADLTDAHPDRPCHYIPLGEGVVDATSTSERAAWRAQLGLPDDAVLCGTFGALTADKRLEPILRAFARTRRRHPAAYLLLAGAPDSSVDTRQLAAGLGITEAVIWLESLDDRAFDRAIASVDVGLHLRWPTAVETSGPWLRALSAGRPTVVVELAHQTHVPALDPRNWQPLNPHDTAAPVTVAIDILDEDHSLGLALDRLLSDDGLRAALGTAARQYWEREHTVSRMTDGYEDVMTRALRAPAPTCDLPDSLRPDPWRHARALVAPFGDLRCELP
jgi:glycosyltransferase involved in cell wall biosynthesis